MGRPRLTGRRPPQELVARIASEEAARFDVALADVLGMGRRSAVVVARQAAWRRIMEEHPCSMNGLADVWGCERQSIRRWRMTA